MCIISKKECDNIRECHLAYLKSLLTDAQDMVFGETNGALDVHQRRLGAEKLQPVVDALNALLKRIGVYQFTSFEDVYEVVKREVITAGCWKNPLLLTYDISLRLAYRLDPVRLRLMPKRFLYLHTAPYRSAKNIAHKMGDDRKFENGHVEANYLDKVFDCGHCDPAQKEHVLCRKHKIIEEMYGKQE